MHFSLLYKDLNKILKNNVFATQKNIRFGKQRKNESFRNICKNVSKIFSRVLNKIKIATHRQKKKKKPKKENNKNENNPPIIDYEILSNTILILIRNFILFTEWNKIIN